MKPVKRRKAADGEQLEIAQAALVERQAGKVFGGRLSSRRLARR